MNGGWVVVFDNNEQHFITAEGVLSFSFVFDVPEGAEGGEVLCVQSGWDMAKLLPAANEHL